MIYGRIFFIIITLFLNVMKEKEVKSASIEDLPHEILEKIIDHSSIGNIENLRYVCKKFYILSYQCFGIGPKIIELLSFEESKNDTARLLSPVLYYRPFHTAYQFKKMFSIFLNSPDITNEWKLAKIKKFKFELDSIPFLFQQAMSARNPTKKDTFFQKGVKLLQLKQNQDDYPVAKDFLAICYRYGLGIEKDEFQAEILEDEVSSHLFTQLRHPWFSWSFQLWIEPIFIQWFEEGSSLLLIQVEKVNDFLNHPFLEQGWRSYACVDFVKNWLKSDSTSEAISSFLKDNSNHPLDRLQLCKFYLSLLIELGIFKKFKNPWSPTWREADYFIKKSKTIQPILKWLKSENFKKELSQFYNTQSPLTFQNAQILVKYLHVLSLLFENLDKFNTFKETIIPDILELFNDKKKDEQDEMLLQKFSFIKSSEIFPNQNWENYSIKHSIQNWLQSETLQARIQNKMLDGSFFQDRWLNFYHIALYFIKKNQELAEKTLEIALKSSCNTFNQVQLAHYLNQLEKFSISHLEKIKERYATDKNNQEACKNEFSMLKNCFKIGCYPLFEKEIKNTLFKNLENSNSQEAVYQWQLAGLCALSGDCKFRHLIHRQWIDLKKIRLIFKKIQIWNADFPKEFDIYILKDSFSSSDIGIIYFNCL